MVSVPPTRTVGVPPTPRRLYATGQSELSLLVAWWGLILEPVVCVVLFFHRTSGDVVSGEPGLCQVEHFLLVGLFGFVCFFLLVVVVSGCFRTGWFWWGLPLLNCLEASGTLSECLFFFGIHSLQLKLQQFPQCKV